jgi:putative hemolysin
MFSADAKPPRSEVPLITGGGGARAAATAAAGAGCACRAAAEAGPAGSELRGVRDFVLSRHGAGPEYTVYPYRPVTLGGLDLDSIDPPTRVTIPPLMRGYLRLGARICGQPAHDPAFGVGDFPALLNKDNADIRYLNRLRSASRAGIPS